jgi:parvulin-like peptidyl-prolyl isomerase
MTNVPRSESALVWSLLAAVACGATACSTPVSGDKVRPSIEAAVRAEATAPIAAVVSPAPRRQPLTQPYPKGRWRLARLSDLLSIRLGLSQILIRHAGVETERPSFSATEWRSPAALTTRTREQAFALAQELADRARAEPERFAELAREHSEDPITGADGGALGGVPANRLYLWPSVLDALAVTKVGEVTNVIETEFGFHVLKREPVPPAAIFSGRHIVIAHDDAPWLEQGAGTPVPRRSREEARALAQRLYERAAAAPSQFGALARTYSDHGDAQREGDFGSWSSQEPTALSREVLTLARLEVGAVAPPIDTLFGFQIIQRTANRARRQFAAEWLALRFDPARPDSDPKSRAAVLARARAFAGEVVSSPARFDALRGEHCCKAAVRVIEGRDDPELEATLARLEPGEIGREPIDIGFRYVIPRRVPLARLEPLPDPGSELPDPVFDIDVAIGRFRGSFIERTLRVVGEQAPSLLGLDGAASEAVRARHELWGRFDGRSSAERRTRFAEQQGEIQSLLSPGGYERYRALVTQHFEQALIEDR